MNDNFGGMDDDSFNVFNQNAEAYKQQQELMKQQAEAAQAAAQQQQQALAQAHEQNLQQQQIQSIQDVDKNPSIFSFLGKKKEKKEERSFDLNDPSTFTKVEKPKKEMDDKQKSKMELILLVVLVVVLAVVGYWAFSVFKNTMGIKKTVDTNDSLIHEVKLRIGDYTCEKNYDNFYLALPHAELINKSLSKYIINYYSDEENKVVVKEEIITVNYGNIDTVIKNEIQKYCNTYNNINDSYQLTCNLSYNVMTIKNSFDLTKIDGTVTNGEIVYDIGLDSNALIKDVINKESEAGSNCNLIENKE